MVSVFGQRVAGRAGCMMWRLLLVVGVFVEMCMLRERAGRMIMRRLLPGRLSDEKCCA